MNAEQTASWGVDVLTMAVGAVCLLALIAAAVIWHLLRRKRDEYHKLRVRFQEQEQVLTAMQDRESKRTAELSELNDAQLSHSHEVNELRTQLSLAQNDLEHEKKMRDYIKEELETKNGQLTELTAHNQELASENARLRADADAARELREQSEKLFEEKNRTLETKLIELGQQMLKERSDDFTAISSEQFRELVNPLQEELDTFRRFLSDTQRTSTEQAGELREQLSQLRQEQVNLTKQTDNLAAALRSGGRSGIMWGEHQLQLVLDSSGLIEGQQYKREFSSDTEYEEYGHPDAIIYLPQNHVIVVDAKCSLSAYSAYINAADDEAKAAALQSHISAIHGHVKELSSRHYEGYKSYNSPSFVFMFVPVDHALTIALIGDDSLYSYATVRNIYLVSPSTLMPALRTVSNLWMLSTQNDRVRKLSKDAQRIYDKVMAIKQGYEEVLRQEKSLTASLTTLGSSLFTGHGNLIKQLEDFNSVAPRVVAELDGHEVEVVDEGTPGRALSFRPGAPDDDDGEEDLTDRGGGPLPETSAPSAAAADGAQEHAAALRGAEAEAPDIIEAEFTADISLQELTREQRPAPVPAAAGSEGSGTEDEAEDGAEAEEEDAAARPVPPRLPDGAEEIELERTQEIRDGRAVTVIKKLVRRNAAPPADRD